MTRRSRLALRLSLCLCGTPGALLTQSTTDAQAVHRPTGSVTGVVTAKRANGEVIKAANVLVALWNTDATTSALRDSACSAWQSDKTAWMQAKQELESPSGMDLTGTPAGRNLTRLNALVALPHDTVRTDAGGSFTFRNVAAGMYTVEAEVYANNMFLQWSKDAGVLPRVQTRADLDASTLGENQYCTVTASDSDAAKVYDTSQLDQPLKELDQYGPSNLPAVRNGSVTIGFVVNENGLPDPKTVTVSGTAPLSIADARRAVAKMRFVAPTVHGRPVKVREGIVITAIMEAHKY